MKRKVPKLTIKQIVILLLLTSGILYLLHYLIFRDFHHISIFFLHDLAGMPLEVILVTLFFDRIIEKSHEEEAQSKLSIIESLFFNETGGHILQYLISFDPNSDKLREIMDVKPEWKDAEYRVAKKKLSAYPFRLDVDNIDFYGLHYHLNERHEYYRNVLENPAMTQSNEFTELVMKIYMMWYDLDWRTDLYTLSEADKQELGHDLQEIYMELVEYWLDNVHNHSIHNRGHLRRLLESTPFTH